MFIFGHSLLLFNLSTFWYTYAGKSKNQHNGSRQLELPGQLISEDAHLLELSGQVTSETAHEY